jgi:colicin import membrane protein
VNDLVFVPQNPQACITNPADYSAFYKAVVAECEKFVPDLSTATSRKEIASLAYKVTRSKTAIDDAGKKLTEGWRKQISEVDETRRKIRNDLEVLAAKVRKPLTEWERAEEDRRERVEQQLRALRDAARPTFGENSGRLTTRIEQVLCITFSADIFQPEEVTAAEQERRDLLDRLNGQLEIAVAHEREQLEKTKEIERLRAEEAKQREAVAAAQKATKEAQAELDRLKARDVAIAAVTAQPVPTPMRPSAPGDPWHGHQLSGHLGCDRPLATMIFDAIAEGSVPHLKVVP